MPTLSHTKYNIGTGTEVRVRQLAEAVAAAAGVRSSDFMPIFVTARQGELVHSCLDVSRARAELDTAAPTLLVDGPSVTIDWIRTAGGVRDAPPRLR
jgi:UDP-glucose 4-epimerase